METVKKQALDNNTRFLQNNVILSEEFFGGLIENQVITEGMMEEIRVRLSAQMANRLKILVVLNHPY